MLKPTLADDLNRLGTWSKVNDKIDANATLPDYANFFDGQFVE
jgi:hypothetical protein